MIKAGAEIKPHIGIYGSCNSGKSSLLNFITGGAAAIVSPLPGTTADPVKRSFEILGFAPVVFIDTAGLDDNSDLGDRRRRKTLETLPLIDLAIVVFTEWDDQEREIVGLLRQQETPFILFRNLFSDRSPDKALKSSFEKEYSAPLLEADIMTGNDVLKDKLFDAIKDILPERSYSHPSMFGGLVRQGDLVLLVCPVDSEAPSGRLILPQVQAVRSLLDAHAIAVVVQPGEIRRVYELGMTPSLIVTDSQAFAEVTAIAPEGVGVTSFSILLARLKGDYATYAEGLKAIEGLADGDRVLILENCLHQTSCEDIGRVKIPRLLRKYSGKDVRSTVVSGLSPLPSDLKEYALAVQCGGCMVTRTQLQNRIRAIRNAGVPVTNYGMALKKLTLER